MRKLLLLPLAAMVIISCNGKDDSAEDDMELSFPQVFRIGGMEAAFLFCGTSEDQVLLIDGIGKPSDISLEVLMQGNPEIEAGKTDEEGIHIKALGNPVYDDMTASHVAIKRHGKTVKELLLYVIRKPVKVGISLQSTFKTSPDSPRTYQTSDLIDENNLLHLSPGQELSIQATIEDGAGNIWELEPDTFFENSFSYLLLPEKTVSVQNGKIKVASEVASLGGARLTMTLYGHSDIEGELDMIIHPALQSFTIVNSSSGNPVKEGNTYANVISKETSFSVQPVPEDAFPNCYWEVKNANYGGTVDGYHGQIGPSAKVGVPSNYNYVVYAYSLAADKHVSFFVSRPK